MPDMDEMKFKEKEAIYYMRYSELADILAFILNHDYNDIPQSIRDRLIIYHEFIADNL